MALIIKAILVLETITKLIKISNPLARQTMNIFIGSKYAKKN